jgi:hypothetical protein
VAQWRWQVENALDARAVHDDTDRLDFDGFDLEAWDPDEPDDAEQTPLSYPAMAVLLRARLAAMPASPTPKPPHGGHREDLTSLVQTLDQLLGGATRANRSGLSGPGRAAKLPAKRVRKERPAPIYQVKVGIRRAKPPIWRRLQLSADTSLATLHHIIQIAFGWDDYHLHVFHTPYGEFGSPTAS